MRFITLLLAFGVLHSAESSAQKVRLVSKKSGAIIRVVLRKVVDDPSQIMYTPGSYGAWSYAGAVQAYNNPDEDSVFVAIDSGYYKVDRQLTLVVQELEKHRTSAEVMDLDKVRQKRYVLDPPLPLPMRSDSDAYVNIGNVAIDMDEKDFLKKNYESYSDFLKRKPDNSLSYRESVDIGSTIFRKDLMKFLGSTGFADTAGKISLGIYDKLSLDLTVKAISVHKLFPFCQFELRTKVEFPEYTGQKPMEVTSFSRIGYDNSDSRNFNNREFIVDALEDLMCRLLSEPATAKLFRNPEMETRSRLSGLPVLELKAKQSAPFNLESATDAVVTVKCKKGHGSGCLISNDGFLVTNFHVVGADTEDVYIIFNNGAKKKANFVRGNALYDLSLLKVDTAVANPIRIGKGQDAKIGSDVYAIGTPEDISLGQSITKGIISARRNMNNRVYLQSDVSVNSGNSGGALTNKEGELIGVVNAKLVGMGVEGVSFAIPSNYIEEFLKVKVVAE